MGGKISEKWKLCPAKENKLKHTKWEGHSRRFQSRKMWLIKGNIKSHYYSYKICYFIQYVVFFRVFKTTRIWCQTQKYWNSRMAWEKIVPWENIIFSAIWMHEAFSQRGIPVWICCGPKNTEALNSLGIQQLASEPLSQKRLEQYLEHCALSTGTDWHLWMLLFSQKKKSNNFMIVPVGCKPRFPHGHGLSQAKLACAQPCLALA